MQYKMKSDFKTESSLSASSLYHTLNMCTCQTKSEKSFVLKLYREKGFRAPM